MLAVNIPDGGLDTHDSTGEPPLKQRKVLTLGPYPMAARLQDSDCHVAVPSISSPSFQLLSQFNDVKVHNTMIIRLIPAK